MSLKNVTKKLHIFCTRDSSGGRKQGKRILKTFKMYGI